MTTAPRRNLRPLSAALAVAVVLGAGGAVASRLTHSSTPRSAVQHGKSSPTPGVRSTPSPTAAPQSLTFAPVFPHDDASLGAPLAYGHLTLAGGDNTLIVGSYRLSVSTDPGSPASAPVWRIDRSPVLDAASLGARFGLDGTAKGNDLGGMMWGAPWGSVEYEPSFSQLDLTAATMPGAGPLPHLDGIPTDAAGAGRLATAYMSRRGLLLDGTAQPRISAGPPGQETLESWIVDWQRTAGGHPIYGTGHGAMLSIGQNGAVMRVLVSAVRRAAPRTR